MGDFTVIVVKLITIVYFVLGIGIGLMFVWYSVYSIGLILVLMGATELRDFIKYEK